jgi:hypothetical protein
MGRRVAAAAGGRSTPTRAARSNSDVDDRVVSRKAQINGRQRHREARRGTVKRHGGADPKNGQTC